MRRSKQHLRYTLRTNDTDGMLQKGYWFLGSENSLYLSFWDIIEHKKTDICFEIQKNETCLLRVHFYHEEENYWNGLVRILGLKSKGGNKRSGMTYEKTYNGTDFKKHLEYFILTERPFINASFKLSSAEDVYSPISESDFLAQLNKIKSIRKGTIGVRL
jgi:hypothetical protein